MKNIFIFFIIFFSYKISFSQNINNQFSPDNFLFYVKKYHPIAKQAKIILEKANVELLSSKGAFDPVAYSYIDEKNFSSKNYYSLIDAGLKVPTWYGLEFKTGYNQSSGVFLNPENDLPVNGVFQAGVSVSLLQGLIIDERRASLNKAKQMVNYSNAEQELVLNDLILEAMTSYWQWVRDYNQERIQRQAVQLAFDRFNSIKQSFIQGDVPAIDTLESFMQYQLRSYNELDAKQNLQESQLKLSTYLWFTDNVPLELTDSLIAPELSSIQWIERTDSVFSIPSGISSNHPFIKQYDYKIKALEIDQKFKSDKLKPKLNVNYNIINEPVNNIPFEALNIQNAKWGVSFSYPLFTRKERGDLKSAGLKIRETDLSRELKRYELSNKLKAVTNEQKLVRAQIDLYRVLIDNFQKLLNAEIDKFRNGESSVFLINTREINLIQAQISFVNINAKYQTLIYKRKWIDGTLFN